MKLSDERGKAVKDFLFNPRKGLLAWLFFIGIVIFFQFQQRRDQIGLNNVYGHVALTEGRIDEAITLFDQVINAKPDWYQPYVGRGAAYGKKGDLTRARVDLDRAIALNPSEGEPYYERGVVLRKAGELDAALTDFAEAVRLDPRLGKAHFARAMILRDREEFQAALAAVEAAVFASPGKADYRLEQGRLLLLQLNEPSRAADAWSAALRAAVDSRAYLELLDHLPGSSPTRVEVMDSGHPFMPDAYYLSLWTHVARVRAGQDDAPELSEHVRQLVQPIYRELVMRSLNPDGADKIKDAEKMAEEKGLMPWPGPLIALFLNRLDEAAVRAQAEAAGDEGERRRRACDIDFYLAIRAIQKAQPAPVHPLLSAATKNCAPDRLEAWLAKLEWRVPGAPN